MKILFVTRKFPPSVGGLETAAQGLYTALAKQHQVKLVKWGGSNKVLPVIYPWLFLRGLWSAWRYKPDIVYVQDGVLAPLGLVIKLLSGRPVVMSVHGLDVTYTNWFYRFLLGISLPRLDQVVVGSDWADQMAKKRFPNLHPPLITYGFIDDINLKESRANLIKHLPVALNLPLDNLNDRRLLLTTGRLVPRKGVAWFIQNVLPGLVSQNPKVLYIVVGDGPDSTRIKRAISRAGLTANVLLLGKVTDSLRNILYNAADLFVMPNVPVLHDGEGFGLVAIEASSCGTPVIGADLEGIKNAVINGRNGLRIKPRDKMAWQRIIGAELTKSQFNRSQVRRYVCKNYSWEHVATQYAKVFRQIISKV